MARPCGPGGGCTKAKASAFVSSFWRTNFSRPRGRVPAHGCVTCLHGSSTPPLLVRVTTSRGLGCPRQQTQPANAGRCRHEVAPSGRRRAGHALRASSFARSPPTHGLSHASARLLRSPPDLARPRPLNQAVASTNRPLPWQPCRLKRPPSQVNSDSADSALPSVAVHVAGPTPVRPRGPLHRGWHSTYDGVVLTGSTSAAGRPAATDRACIH